MARRTTSARPPPTRAQLLSRGRSATVTEGAFVGGPFLVLIPVAFCAALLRQTRTVLELAALTGRDPTERDRAAEILVLQGVYDDVPAARAGLSAAGARAPRSGSLRRPAVLGGLTLRMARLLGLLTPAGPGGRPGRWSQAARWLLLVVVFLVGLAAPLVWLPYMADSYDRATVRLHERAVRFYFPRDGSDGAPPRPRRLDPAALAGAGRALLSVLVPVALAAGVLLADLRIAGGTWPVLGIVLTAASVTTGAVWWWRRGRTGDARAPDRTP
ncbi:hypothetical protein ACFW91_02875 [Streptomyces asoensis]|uniref:hypothetical protein n=1 Tax=Streptomyces asoensis TaxID=249586 RepID=UPI0036C7C8FF